MTYFVNILIIIVNFILQSTFFEYIQINGIKPNTIIPVVVSISLLSDEFEGGISGFIAGILIDIFFAQYLGLNAALCFLIGYFGALAFRGFYSDNFFMPIIISTLFLFLYEFAYYIFEILLQGYKDFGYFFIHIILPELVYTAFFVMPIYLLTSFLKEKADNGKRKIKKIY